MHDENRRTDQPETTVAFDAATILRTQAGHSPLSRGTRIEKLEIVDLIGDSDADFVYLAQDFSLDRRVALKEYMPHAMAVREGDGSVRPTPGSKNGFATGLHAFVNEALVLSRLNNPALIKVHRYWEDKGTAYAVMPLHEGMSLEQAIVGGRIAINEIWIRALLVQLVDAVEEIHRARSCHGNISPDTVCVRADGRPLLLEFDAARGIVIELTKSADANVRPGFSSIEQYPGMAGMPQGPWTDVYALGAVAYYMIAGKAPPAAIQRARHDTMRSASEIGRGMFSDTLLTAIDSALVVIPDRRTPSAAEWRRLLNGLASDTPRFSNRANHAREAILADRLTQLPQVTATTHVRTMAPALAPYDLRTAPVAVRATMAPEKYPFSKASASRTASALRSLLVLSVGLGLGAALGAAVGYQHLYQTATNLVAGLVGPADIKPASSPSTVTPAATDITGTAVTAGTTAGVAPAVSASPQPAALPAMAMRESVDAPTPPPLPATADLEQAVAPRTEAVSKALPAPPATSHRAPKAVDRVTSVEQAKVNEPDKTVAEEREAWRIASYLDVPASYVRYLDRHPSGPNAPAARKRLAEKLMEAGGSTTERTSAGERKTDEVSSTSRIPPGQAGTGSDVAQAERSKPAPPKSADTTSAMTRPSLPRAPAASYPDYSGTASGRTMRVAGQTLTGDFTTDAATGALSGTGRIVWPNGDRFDGTLVNGSKEGRGQFVWKNGQRYNGEWANNEPNGRGTILFANGNRYDGEVANGSPNGRGVLTFVDNTRYEGEIRNGVANGRGTIQFADGSRYDGQFRSGLPHGQGVTRFRNGDIYSGELANGKSHGQGRFVWANGAAWEGEFRNGQRTDNGQIIAGTTAFSSSGGSPAVSSIGTDR